MPRIIFNLRANGDPLTLIKKARATARAADRATEVAHVDAHKAGQRLKYGIPSGTEEAVAGIERAIEKIVEARSSLAAAHHELDQLAHMAKE